jgi:stage II sporulation protein D
MQIGARKYRGEIHVTMESGKAEVINHVSMAEYVAGSLASEMPASWHMEALKAQAVAIRTYTLFTLLASKNPKRNWDVDDTTAYLRYAGFGGEKGDLGKPYQDRVREAGNSTNGEVMLHKGSIFKAYFHSTSGGQTTSCSVAFGQPTIAPLAGSDLGNHGEKSSFHRWSRPRRTSEVMSALNTCIPIGSPALGELRSIQPADPDDGGWPTKLTVTGSGGKVEVSATAFRRALGTGIDGLPSTNFTATASGQGVTFDGRGWGHGVGLDQWAASGMANSGHTYRAILRTMYPESEILRLTSN